MLREEVMTKLTDIIVHDIFFEDGEERQIEINENSELTALGFDSIALMTLFVCLEDEFFITMTDEELKAVPYFGNMKPFTIENAAQAVDAPVATVSEQDDDLPF